jgi:hypothetical protein
MADHFAADRLTAYSPEAPGWRSFAVLAGPRIEDLAEHVGGGVAAGGLGRPYGGQGDPKIDEQGQCCQSPAEEQQHVVRQGHGDGGDGGDGSGGCFHEDEDAGQVMCPALAPEAPGTLAESGR